jgi:hypothetical protein
MEESGNTVKNLFDKLLKCIIVCGALFAISYFSGYHHVVCEFFYIGAADVKQRAREVANDIVVEASKIDAKKIKKRAEQLRKEAEETVKKETKEAMEGVKKTASELVSGKGSKKDSEKKNDEGENENTENKSEEKENDEKDDDEKDASKKDADVEGTDDKEDASE